MNRVENIVCWSALPVVLLAWITVPTVEERVPNLALEPVRHAGHRVTYRGISGMGEWLEDDGRGDDGSMFDFLAHSGRRSGVSLGLPTGPSASVVHRQQAQADGDGLLGELTPKLGADLFPRESGLFSGSGGDSSRWGWLAEDVRRMDEVRGAHQRESLDLLAPGRAGLTPDPFGRLPSLFEDE